MKGDNLKGTGRLDAFVPGIGPLLRPTGRGVDDMGEALWEAGYFGPVQTTPRPTEAEVIAAIEDQLLTGNKRYAFGDDAPLPAERGDGIDPDAMEAEDIAQRAEREARWARLDTLAEAGDALGLTVLMRDLDRILADYAEGSGDLPPLRMDDFPEDPEELVPYLLDVINRELDDARTAAFVEAEDEIYDAVDTQFREATAAQDRAGAEGGGGQAADARDAGPQRAGGEAGPADARNPELAPARADALDAAGLRTDQPPAPETSRAFDADDGEGIRAAAESDWHDIRQASETDPDAAARARQERQLRADAPLRGENRTGQAQDGEMGLGLFDAADQPKFDLDDGKGARPAMEIRAEIDADKAAIEEIRKCL